MPDVRERAGRAKRAVRPVHRLRPLPRRVPLHPAAAPRQGARPAHRRDLPGVRRADGDQDGALRRVPRLHQVPRVQAHATRAAGGEVPEVRRGRPGGAPHAEGTELLRVPALPGVRLLHVEPPGRGRLPELRVRRDGRETDQDQRGLSQVPQVRTRSHGRGADGGAALAVDRLAFAQGVHDRITGHPGITVARGEVTELESPGVVATGPLTSEALATAIARKLDATSLAFFDAIAPIVSADSLDTTRLFRASRYGKGSGDDYWNAPLTEPEYDALVEALRTGEQYQPHHEFDRTPYFEGCLPVEEMAARGRDVLRFGPMKPVGLGTEAFAVVQLRQEDRAGQMWNLVGFQTRLKVPEQQRVFRMIPGLEAAEFLRFGSIHRNAYINSPRALTAHLSAKDDATLLFAGQLTGVEGYSESAATGILAGINLARLLGGDAPVVPPPTTMLGALYRYVHSADPAHFQPMNANFGLLDPLERVPRDKQKKREHLVERALRDMDIFARGIGVEVTA